MTNVGHRFKKHIPLHLYIDQGIYFVTARTIKGKRFFTGAEKLNIISSRLNSVIRKFKIKLHAWVILPNHYHILFTLIHGKNLSELVQYINGGSSRQINEMDGVKNRKIWWNYWDRSIRNERDFYVRFNYIHHNPVKHGYVKNNGDYRSSSYNYYRQKFGQDFLLEAERVYPIKDFTGIKDDG